MSAEEMEDAIITRANEYLKPGDILYHLGDVSWSSYDLNKYFSRLNTKHIHLIYGNHDKPKVTQHKNIASYSDIKNLSTNEYQIVLCHYSMQHWRGRGHGAYHLYGHSHGNSKPIGRSMDVGVDTNNFYPYSLDEVITKLKDIPFYDND